MARQRPRHSFGKAGALPFKALRSWKHNEVGHDGYEPTTCKQLLGRQRSGLRENPRLRLLRADTLRDPTVQQADLSLSSRVNFDRNPTDRACADALARWSSLAPPSSTIGHERPALREVGADKGPTDSLRDFCSGAYTARGVQAAGLKMPRQHMNLERLAWLYQVLLAIKRPNSREVAFVISGFINGASGIAFPEFKTIAKALHWEPGDHGVGYRRVSHAVRGLALDGFLIRSPGNARGAHGRIGPSFALTLPGVMTWQEQSAPTALFSV